MLSRILKELSPIAKRLIRLYQNITIKNFCELVHAQYFNLIEPSETKRKEVFYQMMSCAESYQFLIPSMVLNQLKLPDSVFKKLPVIFPFKTDWSSPSNTFLDFTLRVILKHDPVSGLRFLETITKENYIWVTIPELPHKVLFSDMILMRIIYKTNEIMHEEKKKTKVFSDPESFEIIPILVTFIISRIHTLVQKKGLPRSHLFEGGLFIMSSFITLFDRISNENLVLIRGLHDLWRAFSTFYQSLKETPY